MKEKESKICSRLKKLKISLSPKKCAIAFILPLMLGLSMQAHANIFDDIGDAIGDAVDSIADLFSSAVNLVEDLVDNIDKEMGEGIASLCSVVKVTEEGGETSVKKAVDKCGGKAVDDLEDAFKSAGGEIADQYKNVENKLESIARETWSEQSENFTDLVETLGSYYKVVYKNMEDAADTVLDAMSDVPSTMENVDFPFGDLALQTNLDFSFSIPLGPTVTIEFVIRGTSSGVITEEGTNYAALDGKFLARLKYFTATPLYQPGVIATLQYTNPIIKYKDHKFTGILVSQPEGEIALDVTAMPFNFTVGLDQLAGIDAVAKLPIIGVAANAIAISIDIGSGSFTVPITGQSGNDLDVSLAISAGIEAKITIASLWAVKVSERISWSKVVTLDIPSWVIKTDDIPDTVKDKLDGDTTEEPSYAERILWLTFDDSNNSSIIEDHSNYGNDASKVGGVTLSNGAATFNGTDGYIDLPDNLMKGVDEITVYAEVLIDEQQEGPFWIYGMGNSKDNLGDGYLFATGLDYRNSISTCHWICEQTTTEPGFNLPRKTWQKIAYTLKGNVAKMYLNGDIVNSKNDMTIKPSDIGGGTTTENFIGRSLYSADKYLKGSVRDFQIWKGALTHKEIVELSAPKPSKSERIMWLTFDDSSSSSKIKDHSEHGNDAKKKGGLKVKNGAAIFDGKDDYIDLPDNIMKDLEEITVIAQVKIDKDQVAPFWIYGLGNSKDELGDGYLFATGNNFRNSLSTCHWICEQTTGDPDKDLPRDSWQTIAYTLKGNISTLYLNGAVVQVKDDMTIKPKDVGGGKTTQNFLGRSLYSADNYLKGSIRDFQIWKGAMTQQEIIENSK